MNRATATYLVGEFGQVSDDDYAALIALARVRVRGILNRTPAELVDQAVTYAAAHLYLRSNAANAGATGGVASYSAGDTSVSFAAGPQQTGAPDDFWRTTGYGSQYLQLRDQLASRHRVV